MLFHREDHRNGFKFDLRCGISPWEVDLRHDKLVLRATCKLNPLKTLQLIPGIHTKSIKIICRHGKSRETITFKGQSKKNFDLKFFLRPTDQWVKIFSILVKFSLGYSIQIFQNLPGIWYPGESISPGYGMGPSESVSTEYDTPASQSPRGIIPRQVNC